MDKKELLEIMGKEASKSYGEEDLKLKLYEAGIDSLKLIRIVVEIEKKYQVKLSRFFEDDEEFENIGDFIEKVQKEIKQ